MSTTTTTPAARGSSQTMYKTHNDISRQTRETVAALLNQSIADLFDLQSQVKHAHWNVKGTNFIALHELFDQVVGNVDNYVDLVAERAVQLGAQAKGTVRTAAASSTLDQYPTDAIDSPEHVEAVSHALCVVGETVRKNIDTTAELGDANSSDIYTEISRGLDKDLWFVEAHKIPARD